MTALRRRLAGLLARWAVRLDPDPRFKFSTARRIDVDYPDFGQFDSITAVRVPTPYEVEPLPQSVFFSEKRGRISVEPPR